MSTAWRAWESLRSPAISLVRELQYWTVASFYCIFVRILSLLNFLYNTNLIDLLGGQEPGDHEEILEFVRKFDAEMDNKVAFFEKADVNGKDAREVYKFLKEKCPADDGSKDIEWNFTKFLVDKQGSPVKRYNHRIPPSDIRSDIEALL